MSGQRPRCFGWPSCAQVTKQGYHALLGKSVSLGGHGDSYKEGGEGRSPPLSYSPLSTQPPCLTMLHTPIATNSTRTSRTKQVSRTHDAPVDLTAHLTISRTLLCSSGLPVPQSTGSTHVNGWIIPRAAELISQDNSFLTICASVTASRLGIAE